MEVRIGITQTPKELELELDAEADDLVKEVDKALGKDGATLWLTDRKGRRVGVPSAKVAYVEIGSGHEERRVGFGAP
ncbi:MAG TPA: DUF3107 domain-containing protein [Acidimicrobiales bacterium]|nr:DUF3107 domain-containing protein [Acidimicrobiales bacterium]